MQTFYIQVGKNTRAGGFNSFHAFAVQSNNGVAELRTYFEQQYSGFSVAISRVDTIDLTEAEPKKAEPIKDIPGRATNGVHYTTGTVPIPEDLKEETRLVGRLEEEFEEAKRSLERQLTANFVHPESIFQIAELIWEPMEKGVVLTYKSKFVPWEVQEGSF